MKHLFVINPVAGGIRDNIDGLTAKISSAMAEAGEEFEIYITAGPMDACSKISAEAESGEELRVYACGGDGTLNECVNGAAGYLNAAVTHYPCGTGNDFIKTFGDDKDKFFELENLISGEIRPIDVIDVNGRKSLDICSVGIDARVAMDVHKYSRLPIIGGAAAYVVSLIVNFFKRINMPLHINADGKIYSGNFALMCACNGRYYGGGFNPVPDAMPDDGIMDVLLVKSITRLQALSLIGKYSAGRYRELGDKVIRLAPQSIELESPEKFVINIDGELIWADRAVFTVIPKGVNMIFPRGMSFFDSRNKESAVI